MKDEITIARDVLRAIAMCDPGRPGEMAREYFAQYRHFPDYEDAPPSNSGKSQWRCRVCGRITQGAERECWTLAMSWWEKLRDARTANATEPTP